MDSINYSDCTYTTFTKFDQKGGNILVIGGIGTFFLIGLCVVFFIFIIGNSSVKTNVTSDAQKVQTPDTQKVQTPDTQQVQTPDTQQVQTLDTQQVQTPDTQQVQSKNLENTESNIYNELPSEEIKDENIETEDKFTDKIYKNLILYSKSVLRNSPINYDEIKTKLNDWFSKKYNDYIPDIVTDIVYNEALFELEKEDPKFTDKLFTHSKDLFNMINTKISESETYQQTLEDVQKWFSQKYKTHVPERVKDIIKRIYKK